MRKVTRIGRDADVNPGASLGRCSKRPSAARVVRGWLDAVEFATGAAVARQVDQHREFSGKKLDGKAADWMEKVTDEQYQA